MYVGPLGPHDPYIVPQRFLDMYPKGTIRLPDSFDDPMLDKPVLYRRTRSRYDQLRVLGYKVCIVPRDHRIPEDGYRVE